MDAGEVLTQAGNRPVPLPRVPWIMQQGWYDLLFAHWEMPLSSVRDLVPSELEIDTFGGRAWISVTPFEVRMRPRGISFLGHLWTFPELNLRTYVRYRGVPGIFFFSLDADSSLAVKGARLLYRLPYVKAQMRLQRSAQQFHFESRRMDGAAALDVTYRPAAASHTAQPGTAEFWLAERYRLYTVVKHTVFVADIDHRPWLLQPVEAGFATNKLAAFAGLLINASPDLTGYSREQEVLIWPLLKA
ncbi:YqjF family protein [Terriglobus albidus]|uniref:YqjF family protein n=1 Tax=Terriglobus albidus TaxID=1592106 RepID=UPI0021DFCAA2|nr:DUF2071 domain-containing protein [Terriglobus albidus]